MMSDDILFKNGEIRKFDPDIDQALAWERVIEEDSFNLKYYGENSFCRATINAIKAISNFIENGEYPEKYLRATH